MDDRTRKLLAELKSAGLSDQAINAAWPSWWSEQASSSKSASAELRFTLARRLGLSPQSLSGDRVEFVWKKNALFKHLSKEDENQQAALSSFGVAIGRSLATAVTPVRDLAGISAETLRQSILRTRPFVDLAGLLAACWGIGVPVVHLRVFPLTSKGMHAMVVRANNQFSILLGRDAQYPAPIAFTLAHEIGHIALGHLGKSDAVIDMDDPAHSKDVDDQESEADNYALKLLTGEENPEIETNIETFGARQLADAVLDAGPPLGIEPGTLALCLAFRTGVWSSANAAMKHIYGENKPVWREVNSFAVRELDWGALGADAGDYLQAVMATSHE